MALRNIVVEGAPVLRKKARTVTRFDEKLKQLAEDMYETMEHADGIGLAANQIAVLKRIFVMNVSTDPESRPAAYVNAEIIEEKGEQEYLEGCLSIPGLYGFVKRPAWIKVRYQDLDGVEHVVEADGLKAVCMCHEMDHLNGFLYRDRAIGELRPVEAFTQGRKLPETVTELNTFTEDV